jgi:enoyl-CoA hydratase
MSNPDSLRLERDGAVLILCNTDAPWNRMTFSYMDALEQAVIDAAADPAVRVLLFTGDGLDNFSVGMDLKQLLRDSQSRGGFEAILDQRRRVLGMIESMAKPSIATLFGNCLGGGLELPLACHFRLAAEQGAKIGLPEMELGTMPAWGGSVRLTRCVGRDRALEMILRARKIDGPEALRIGLVQAIHPLAELKAAALALAHELAGKPPIAMAGALRAVIGGEDLSLEQALDLEREGVRHCFASRDQAEGISAFIEKRQANFIGS